MEIRGLGPTPGMLPPTSHRVGEKTNLDSFGALLSDATDRLNELQWEADANICKLATGEPIDLHEAIIAMEQATLAFELALQVRNRLVEAYQEVMHMQV